MEESSSQQKPKLTLENSNNHQNGTHNSHSNEHLSNSSNNRLPSPGLFYTTKKIKSICFCISR
jgi:hypothetical protein